MILSVYGTNIWGIEHILGYGRIHVPVNTSSSSKFEVDLSVPKCTDMWSNFVSLLSLRGPELKDPKILADGRNDYSNIEFRLFEFVCVI